LKTEDAKKLAEAAGRLEHYFTKEEPSGEAAAEASVFATMVERFASGLSRVEPESADALFASRIRIMLGVARSVGVPISWEMSKWGRAWHLLELSAYCEDQARRLSKLSPQNADSLCSQAESYRSAALSLLGEERHG
jgi:hypothetical protein